MGFEGAQHHPSHTLLQLTLASSNFSTGPWVIFCRWHFAKDMHLLIKLFAYFKHDALVHLYEIFLSRKCFNHRNNYSILTMLAYI